MQSTYITWNKVCKFHGVPASDWKFNGQYNYVEFTNGSRIDLLDLKYLPSDPLYERLGSLEYSDGAIDEAGEINVLAYEVLKSRIGRHLADKIRPTLLMGGNPSKNWTHRLFYKPWKDGNLEENKAFIVSKYQDNPYTAEAYGQQLAKLTDAAMKARLMYGDWEYDEDPNTMMKIESINDLFTNTITLDNNKYLVCDAARFGRDHIVIGIFKGLDWYKVVYKQKQNLEETKEDILDLCQKEMIPRSHVLIDEDGVGGGLVDMLQGSRGFVANRSPLINLTGVQIESLKSNYKNLKSQCVYKMAEMVKDALIRVSFKDEHAKEMLVADLEQYRVKNTGKDKKLEIISKDEMKERLGRSPDFGDVLLMRMWFELKKISDTIVEYKQPAYEPVSQFEGGGEKTQTNPFNMFE